MASARYAAALQDLAQLALFGMQPGTDRLAVVLRRLGQPQHQPLVIHIAGTNGKGSTAAYCAALLGQAAQVLRQRGAAPLRIGLYTSPHLQRVRERIQLSDDSATGLRECSEDEFVRALSAVRTASATAPAVTLTFFEVLTAAAWVIFRQVGVHVAVVETGLGGRLDATRLCDAQVAVITSIGLDHQELLGPTLTDIAREKAGIFRTGVTALAACDDAAACAALQDEARRVGAPLRLYGPPDPQQPWLTVAPLPAELAAAVPLPGEHQLRNAALAVVAVQTIPLPEPLFALLRDPQVLRAGLARTRWPGRLERVWPAAAPSPIALPPDVEVWLDAAHNPEGAQALHRWLQQTLFDRPLTVLFGVVAGKQVRDMTAPLQHAHHVVLTQPPSPRALPTAELHAQLATLPSPVQAIPDWQAAVHAAVAHTPPGSVLLIYGSIFLVAAVRGWLLGEEVDSLTVQDPAKSPAAP